MKKQESRESQEAMRMLSLGLLMGLASVPIYALYSSRIEQFFVVLSIGWLLCGSAALVGGTLGFLFGIPRTLQQEDGNAPAPTELPGSPAQPQPRTTSYRANTNLEQISDWLTKILVGVGLIEIDSIRQGLYDLTLQAAKGLGEHSHSQVFAAALIGFAAVLGFLFGYLWTRLHLAGAMRIADQAAIGALAERVQRVEGLKPLVESVQQEASREIEGLKQQAERDANALNLVYRQLNPNPELPAIAQDKLDEALRLASRPIRVQAFNKAWQVRADNWRDRASKDKMALTIPIFRALIRNDPDRQFHMNHGQLGFALKDKEPPDWEEAETELSTAIDMRGDWREKGWLYYEFARAICRIMRDTGSEASAPDVRAAILADLQAAMHAEDIRNILTPAPRAVKDPSVAQIDQWLSKNHLSKSKLLSGAGPKG